METKELKIQVPEGYEIDKDNSTFEKIVLKKKGTKPRSWKEYCENTKRSGTYFIGPTSGIIESYCTYEPLDIRDDRNSLPSKELAEAFLAMMQLISLRQAWIHKWSIDNGMTDDWEPNWTEMRAKWNIIYWQNQPIIYATYLESRTLSFPKKEMAEDFMNCFKDLLNTAKQLI